MSTNPDLENIVNTLVSASDPAQVKSLYAQWTNTYDKDLAGFGYVAPGIGVKLLNALLDNQQALIHDAGCGTGQVGALLSDLGYTKIHGSDFSSEMLDKADRLGCYGQLDNIDFGKPIDIQNDVYDAVISIGVYTKRFKQHFIAEMLRITRPGGYFIFSCRELYYDEVMDVVVDFLKRKSVSRLEIELDDYMTGQEASAYYVVLKKTSA